MPHSSEVEAFHFVLQKHVVLQWKPHAGPEDVPDAAVLYWKSMLTTRLPCRANGALKRKLSSNSTGLKLCGCGSELMQKLSQQQQLQKDRCSGVVTGVVRHQRLGAGSVSSPMYSSTAHLLLPI